MCVLGRGVASGGAAVAQGQRQGHLRRGFRRKGDAKKMSGNGWLCDKVRILFWNWPKSSPFFHAGCASCGVLVRGSGASVAENLGGFWEILAADFGRFRSSFRRFSWAFWGRVVGSGLVLADRRARGDEKRCIRQHARCGMHRKRGSWGGNPSKTCPQLVGEWVPLFTWAEGGGGFRRAAVANRCRTARRGGECCRFRVGKG